MASIINGTQIAEKIKDNIVKEIAKLGGARPNLAIIFVGERADSKLYVQLKEKEAKKVGIDTHLYKCPSNTPEKDIIEMIDCLNKDKLIDAILVQLPLPAGFNTDEIIKAIDPAKDADRFHPDNLEKLLATCNHFEVMPPLFMVVLKILEEIDFSLEGKQACVIANSDKFGKSLAKILECKQAKVGVVTAEDHDLERKTIQADLLVTAVGRPGLVTKDMIKKDAVIIDIGITKEGKIVSGDVDFEDVKDKAGFITPVPGGVGPMTIAMLFQSTLALHKARKK
ncbi:bifunctional 5,10-methylenetetrahydrofolate dehydrogenase/5,10-methenyltetrahydrofolate cyclohydrolase [Patescibacteria group bacterium]